MNTIEPKDGLSSAFFGTIFGVAVLVFIQIVSAAISGTDFRPVPTLTFDENPFKFVGDYLAYFFSTTPGLMFVVVTVLCYLLATYYVQKSTATSTDPTVREHDTSGTMRGWLIGLTSGMNFILAYNIYGEWFNSTVGFIIAIALFVLGILGSITAVSQFEGYQGAIGWLCWLAPMSWLVLWLGLIFLVLNVVLGLIVGKLFGVDVFKVGGDKTSVSVDPTVKGKRLTADWATGTFFLIGGITSNLNPHKTAFDLGNIGFIHREGKGDYRAHEAGHNLNLFTYGWIVHLIGAVDENIVGYRSSAISERMAESHESGGTGPKLEVWN